MTDWEKIRKDAYYQIRETGKAEYEVGGYRNIVIGSHFGSIDCWFRIDMVSGQCQRTSRHGSDGDFYNISYAEMMSQIQAHLQRFNAPKVVPFAQRNHGKPCPAALAYVKEHPATIKED